MAKGLKAYVGEAYFRDIYIRRGWLDFTTPIIYDLSWETFCFIQEGVLNQSSHYLKKIEENMV